jgi:NitT/TauT family transport system substrate-binding protein
MSAFSRSFVAAVAAAGMLAMAACGGGSSTDASGDTKINFGYIGDFNGSSLIAVANKQGLWKKEGLDVSTKVFTDGPTQIQALGAKDLDFGYIGPGAIWLPASGKAKIIAIDDLGNSDRVVAQPGVTSLSQLKGKKIGVPQGTSGDMILALGLKKAGLTTKDVKIVPMDAPTIATALVSGQIDAAGIWYPLLGTLEKKKPGLVELAKDSDFSDTMSFPTAFVAGNSVPAATRTKVVKVLREAMDYRAQHTTDAIADTASLLKLPVATVTADASHNKVLTAAELDQATTSGEVGKWLSALNSFFVDAGKLKTTVDPKTYYLGDEFTSAAS